MTRADALSSINCTQCGAGLSVLGGGRVLSHVCGYCGAVLDTQDNYKILTSIGKRDHPDSPVKIGMSLTYRDVPFTVIGTLGMSETYRGRTWRWVEHQLFSPTHGYAWLSWEDGNVLFTRKIRDFNMGHWLSSGTVENAETPPTRQYAGERYKYYETTVAQIDFMEGEFNWVPRIGETTETITLLGPSAMLSLTRSETEREVELTTLMDRDTVLSELGLDAAAIGSAQRHPLTPYKPMREEGFLRRSLLASAIGAVVLAVTLSGGSGSVVMPPTRVPVDSLPKNFSFDVTNASQLSIISVQGNADNGWSAFSAEVAGPSGEPLTAGVGVVEYYQGIEDGERWSEGSNSDSIRFRPAETGTHTITLALEEDGTEGLRGRPASTVTLSVEEGKISAFWLIIAAVLFGLGWIAVTARRSVYHVRRFAGSDWSD